MLTQHKPRTNQALYVLRAALLLFGGYLVYHAFHGDHGLIAHAEVRSDVERLTLERDALADRLMVLQARVDALQESELDGDLLDERARQTLAVIGPNERILRR